MPTDTIHRPSRSLSPKTGTFRLSLAAALLFAPLAWPQANPAGHWEGMLSVGPQQIGLSLDLAKNARSEWEASMGVPAEKMTGMVVSDVVVNGSSVRFTGVELMMAKFDLTLGPDGTMKGTIAAPQGPTQVEFKRTGDPKVELISPSPAVSKQLEGDWEGTLQPPNAPPGAGFPLTFHFKNRPDNTVAATIDSPARNAMGLPLDHVKQEGSKVEFGVKIAGSVFRGELNRAGTELSGQFVHEGQGVPLTLRKK